MQTFPTDDMKHDHMDGYCMCKVLIQSSPVLHLQENSVRPLGASIPGAHAPQVPCDFKNIMGEKLPDRLYYLMLQGIISHKLPQALAKGEWMDKSQPLVDTAEFRALINDLQEYRQYALGLIARHLNAGFAKKNIVCRAFWDLHPGRQPNGIHGGAEQRIIQPKKLKSGLRWRINKDAVEAEMRRQHVDKIDFKFCLRGMLTSFTMRVNCTRMSQSLASQHSPMTASLLQHLFTSCFLRILSSLRMTVG